MADEPDHPMAVAMQWVARVFAAALMMSLPGVSGQWLDRRWGVSFFGPAGFVLGLIGGVVYLIAVTRAADAARRAKTKVNGENDRRERADLGPPSSGH